MEIPASAGIFLRIFGKIFGKGIPIFPIMCYDKVYGCKRLPILHFRAKNGESLQGEE